MSRRLVFENTAILTLDAEDKPQYYPNGTVVVKDDLIVAVIAGVLEEKDREADDQVIESKGKLVMPGLTDLHFHTACVKGWNDHLPLWEYLDECWYPSIRALDDDLAYWSAMCSYLEAIKCGTTNVNDMYRVLSGLARAAKDIGIRATLANDVALDEHKLDTLEDNMDAWRKFHGTAEGRISVRLGIEWVCLSDAAQLKETAALAKKHDIGIHIHLNESEEECRFSLQKFGKTSAALAYECGILGPNTVAAHCVFLSDEEIGMFAETGTHISHNPSSNAKLGNGVARLLDYQKAGINIGLGHDAAECNNSNSMIQVMKFCSLIHRAVNKNSGLLMAREILQMACVNGAKALGIKAGIIAPGYKADFLLLNLNHYAFTPLDIESVDQVMSHIVFAADGDVVDTSVINGVIVMQNRKLTLVDEQQILDEMNKAFIKIKSTMKVMISKPKDVPAA